MATGLAAQVLVGTVTTGQIVLLLVAIVLGLAAAVATLCATQRKNKRRWLQQVAGLLKLGKDGELPRLSTLNPYELGVWPSSYGDKKQRGNDPYVRCTATDRALDEALPSERFVLVVGDSLAGKSRTAYEAAKRLTQDGQPHDPRVLVLTNSTRDLAALLALDPPLELGPEPALLWLDALTSNDLAELTPARLERLTEKMIVLGTITGPNHSRVLESKGDISRTAQEALRGATSIRLEAALDIEDRPDAEKKYPNERFDAGIGETLVSLSRLTAKYSNAELGADPHGWAVVRATIDWTRMDIGRPITHHELVALCPLYLHQLRPRADHDDEGHAEALRWAREPVVSHSALVMKVPSDEGEASYEPFDYLVEAADGQDGWTPKPIPDAAWDTVVDGVSSSEALRAGVTAYFRRLLPRAQTIFTFLAAKNSDVAPTAAFSLGVLLDDHGEVEEAKVAYQQAIASGHPDAAPRAMYNLGVLLYGQSNLEGAKAVWQQAIASGHPDAAPRAMYNLGVLYEKQGNLEEAEAAYQQALASGHPDAAPRAMYSLGLLLQGQGRIEEAEAAYLQALASGHPDAVTLAAARLDLLGGTPPPTAS